jgi:hypothetical protein
MRLPTFQPSQPSNAFRLLKTLMPLFVPRSWQDETCRFRAQARPQPPVPSHDTGALRPGQPAAAVSTFHATARR